MRHRFGPERRRKEIRRESTDRSSHTLKQSRRIEVHSWKLKPAPYRVIRTKILVVSTEFFTAFTHWSNEFGSWRCTKADPKLDWMLKLSPDQAKLALLKMGAQFTWADSSDQGLESGRQFRTVATNQSAGTTSSGTASCVGEVSSTHSADTNPIQSAVASHSVNPLTQDVVPTAGGVPNTAPIIA